MTDDEQAWLADVLREYPTYGDRVANDGWGTGSVLWRKLYDALPATAEVTQ